VIEPSGGQDHARPGFQPERPRVVLDLYSGDPAVLGKDRGDRRRQPDFDSGLGQGQAEASGQGRSGRGHPAPAHHVREDAPPGPHEGLLAHPSAGDLVQIVEIGGRDPEAGRPPQTGLQHVGLEPAEPALVEGHGLDRASVGPPSRVLGVVVAVAAAPEETHVGALLLEELEGQWTGGRVGCRGGMP